MSEQMYMRCSTCWTNLLKSTISNCYPNFGKITNKCLYLWSSRYADEVQAHRIRAFRWLFFLLLCYKFHISHKHICLELHPSSILITFGHFRKHQHVETKPTQVCTFCFMSVNHTCMNICNEYVYLCVLFLMYIVHIVPFYVTAMRGRWSPMSQST